MRFYLTILILSICSVLSSQDITLDPEKLDGLKYRSIGPSRGGRVTAVCGVPSQIHRFYMGSTGGGVWVTDDAGITWTNISDEYFKVGSIGSIVVPPSDPHIIYVGTGSACPRGNISMGNGMYKSDDGGKSWEHIGLEKAGMIGKIEVHPDDPQLLYVAALGNPFGPNEMRGVFRSSDGGKTWEKIFFVSDRTGAVDLVMHPSNPKILYAAMWTTERKPWTLIDGSEEGGIWRSKDGGENWERVLGGLPQGIIGRSGISISPVNPDRIYVIQETDNEKQGGLYRSDDGGKSWSRVNRDHKLRQRAWYYNHVVAHPTQEQVVYVMNVRFHKSIDAGKTFENVRTPHGDNHALWINPDQPLIMIEGNDGGACVTLNGGKTWSTQHNQPTAEFYRVSVDNQFPYRVYGAQQDNTTISVPSKMEDVLDPIATWQSAGGGESGHIAVDPRDPNLIYAGTYIGQIDRSEKDKGLRQDVMAYPQMHDGTEPRHIKYRFQWNAPIRISPHNPDIVYHCSQFVHKTEDRGKTWAVISPDLSLAKDAYHDIPGGPVQHDHTGVELYGTIFSFEESPHAPGELWTGSDDGLIHLSRDHGLTWNNITPSGMPQEGTINSIELSDHLPGRALVAVYKYRDNDLRPYIFITNDYGASWELATNGIPEDHFVRVVREDKVRQGLLYAGTEFGMYLSLDDGNNWQPLQLNLPFTPITDLAIAKNDLVVATQGRSFWILDDLTPLQYWNEKNSEELLHIFPVQPGIRSQLAGNRRSDHNQPNGAVIYFSSEATDTNRILTLEIIDSDGNVRRTFSSNPEKESKHETLQVKAGLNRFIWDLRFEKPVVQEKAVFSLANLGGIKAPPGEYKVRMQLDSVEQTVGVSVQTDPRWEVTDVTLIELYSSTMKAKNALENCHKSIGTIRSIQRQLKQLSDRDDVKNLEDIQPLISSVRDSLSGLENWLIQTKSESRQDPINYPSRIDDQFAYLYSTLNSKDDAAGKGAEQRLEDLQSELEPLLKRLEEIIETVQELNQKLKQSSIQVIEVPVQTIKP